MPTEADWRQTPDDFALTVVAAPLGACAEVLEGIAAERRRGLVFDIGSVKAPLAKGLTALRESGCRAASLHPMFGPDAHVLHGCHVLVMDVGRPEDADEAASVFSGTMAEILRIPLAEHDPLIAYVLGLSHALNLAFVTALVESGEQAPRLARLSSVTFDRQLRVAAAVDQATTPTSTTKSSMRTRTAPVRSTTCGRPFPVWRRSSTTTTRTLSSG